MSRSPSPLRPAATLAGRADGRALAQLLRSLEEKPAVAALCGPLDSSCALLATLAASLGPDLRAIVVHGGALDPHALCEQALRALRAVVSEEPRVVFEAYLAHLRSRSKGLVLLIEAADAFPPATLDCLARWARSPASALRLVAAGREPTSLVRLLDLCGTRGPLIGLAHGMGEDETREIAAAHRDRRPAAVAPGQARTAKPALVAGLAAVLGLGLLWSLTGNEVGPPLLVREIALDGKAPATNPAPAGEPGGVDASADPAPHRGTAALASDANPRGVESGGSSPPGGPEASDRAPAPSQSLAEALDALEAGDTDAYKRALRQIDGPAAGHAEAELLHRLDEPSPRDPARARRERMLAAWGLGVVGGREALPSLDLAAGDADRHLAHLAARSAAVIRWRLAAPESDSTPR